MNPISAFFVRNIIVVFFFYGLAFFVMGLALALASRQSSQFKFVQAIRPLAMFGILHGIHEWFEMFQKMVTLTGGHAPTITEEIIRLAILGLSFYMLLLFGVSLLSAPTASRWQKYAPVSGMVGLWALGLFIAIIKIDPPPGEMVALADALARYSLGIPGALLGTWALMAQQRTFRERNMPQFGRDLVWSAAALFLYGVIGQLFVRPTLLAPSTVLNSTLFLQWFGIPVQLFRGVMAAVLTFYMIRALRAFELENRQRLEKANQAKLAAQTAALEAERRVSREMERLNEELRLRAQELGLLLDLSNLLAVSISLHDRLQDVLEKIISSLEFSDAGLILLTKAESESLPVQVSTGFSHDDSAPGESLYCQALELGELCIARETAVCRHRDGNIINFPALPDRSRCQQYESPMVMISLPLTARLRVIGSLVLCRLAAPEKPLAAHEFSLIVGIVQQLGLSIENARLNQEAQKREKMLGELLHQVVVAQEAERQRIARELHDATGQSLTAIALGLRGIEGLLANASPLVLEQIRELKSFGTNALGELRRLISDLRPPQLDDLGLVDALQWYAQAFEKRRSIRTRFVVEGQPVRLPSEYETVLFRIVQEALTNVAKHAQAGQATVKLQLHPAQIKITIVDDGRGFDPQTVLAAAGQPAGWGLLGIRERALLLGGQYEIDSTPGGGTQISVTIPLVEALEDVENKAIAG